MHGALEFAAKSDDSNDGKRKKMKQDGTESCFVDQLTPLP